MKYLFVFLTCLLAGCSIGLTNNDSIDRSWIQNECTQATIARDSLNTLEYRGYAIIESAGDYRSGPDRGIVDCWICEKQMEVYCY